MSGFIVGLIVTIHIVVCISLMVSILLQSGKGGGLAGAFGAGSSQTLFGGRGAATFLSRATTALAVIFFLTSLTLGVQAARTAGGGRSLVQEEARRRGQQRAVTEGAGAPTTGAPARPAAPTTGAPTTGTSTSGASTPSPNREAPPTQIPGAAGGGAPAPATGGQ